MLGVITLSILAGCRPAETRESVAREVQSAFVRKDAEAIVRRLDPDEMRLAGVDSAGVERFLKQELFDRYTLGAGAIESGSSMDSGAEAAVTVVSPGGRKTSMTLRILASDRGFQLTNLFQAVFFSTEALSLLDRGENLSAKNRMRLFAEASVVRGAKLQEAYGLKGVVDQQNQFQDWQAMAARFRVAEAKLSE